MLLLLTPPDTRSVPRLLIASVLVGLLASPNNVVVVGGLAIAELGYDPYVRLLWPLLLGLLVVDAATVAIAAALAWYQEIACRDGCSTGDQAAGAAQFIDMAEKT